MRRLPARLPVWCAAACVLVAGGLVGTAPARAVYECGGVQDTCNCGMNNFCICCDDAAHGTAHGNCVWYAWHKACCVWGVGLGWCTNASEWDTGATSHGYPLRTEPCANTIFQCEVNTSQCGSGGYGHVGWVETAYPNGSIDVTEQGCYSWYGVRSRTIQAQNASPPMHYIYNQGQTCSTCECNPGDVESRDCGLCGTESRTCGSNCQWGGWSGCQNEGVCSPGQSESRDCGLCGTESRTCDGNCQWGSWSGCQNEGVCQAGTTQPCGQCGGTQTCDNTCQWGACVESCPPDAAVGTDASPGVDAQGPVPDAQGPAPDAQGPAPDAQGPAPDAGPGAGFDVVTGGCHCQGQPQSPARAPALPLLLFGTLGLLLRRRRR